MKRSREPEEDPVSSSTNQGDVAVVPVSKIVGLDVDSPSPYVSPEMTCSLPGHSPGLTFASYKDYESHYIKAHTNRCLDCRRSFPSTHILDLHINEFHNALTELKREKGEATLACFVETCDEMRKTPAERRVHLIEQHMFPVNYFFAVTKAGIDRRQSMLVERNGSKPQPNQRRGHRTRGQKVDETSKSSNPDTEKAHGSDESKDVSMREPDELDEPDRPDEPNAREQTTARGQTSSQKAVGKMASTKGNGVPVSEPNKAAGKGQNTTVPDTEMEDLAGAMSSLKFVPRANRFGSKQRAGFAHQ